MLGSIPAVLFLFNNKARPSTVKWDVTERAEHCLEKKFLKIAPLFSDSCQICLELYKGPADKS